MPHVDQRKRKPLLLHACCGPCATHVIELLSQDYHVTVFYYNPNIQPEEEYEKRLKAIVQYCLTKGIALLRGPYENIKWVERAGAYKDEPEGGKRCEICFVMRLEEAARKASEMNIQLFATTLTISPHKDARLINRIGREAGLNHSITFLIKDFKENNGYSRSCEMSRLHGLYRQNYCGCLFSKK